MVVQDELWDARFKWRNLGIQLGTRIEDLETIGVKNSNVPDSCFTDCIITWLRQTNPPPTWTTLIKALQSRTVGFHELAEHLERKYLQPIPITNHEEVIKFPHIDEVAMDPQQRKQLEQRLTSETKDIKYKFYILINRFFDTLEDRNIPVQRLARYLEGPLGKEMKQLSNIKGIRCIIQENSSFYDYQFLAYMIELVGTDNDKKQLCEYKEAFVVYAQRRVFECPCQFGAKRNPNDTELHVKLDANYECKLDELQEFQSRLCVILKVCVYITRLVSVEKGCFKLLLLLPQHIQASAFPLSMEQENELVLLGILQLSCSEYDFSKPNLKVRTSHVHLTKGTCAIMFSPIMHQELQDDDDSISSDYEGHSSETQTIDLISKLCMINPRVARVQHRSSIRCSIKTYSYGSQFVCVCVIVCYHTYCYVRDFQV